jgi:hypothetical protein
MTIPDLGRLATTLVGATNAEGNVVLQREDDFWFTPTTGFVIGHPTGLAIPALMVNEHFAQAVQVAEAWLAQLEDSTVLLGWRDLYTEEYCFATGIHFPTAQRAIDYALTQMIDAIYDVAADQDLLMVAAPGPRVTRLGPNGA